MTSIKTLFKM